MDLRYTEGDSLPDGSSVTRKSWKAVLESVSTSMVQRILGWMEFIRPKEMSIQKVFYNIWKTEMFLDVLRPFLQLC